MLKLCFLHRKCRQKAQGWGRGVIILVGNRPETVRKKVGIKKRIAL